MMRLLIIGGAVAATIALAACGGGGSDAATPANDAATVTVRSIGGVGDVLVDPSGKALYSSDVEAGGKVRCTGACNSFWTPLTIDSGTPKGSASAGKLGVIERPDGARQVTAGGKPLYTFSEDMPGAVEGNGIADEFGGERFTWTVARAGGDAAGAGAAGATRDGY